MNAPKSLKGRLFLVPTPLDFGCTEQAPITDVLPTSTLATAAGIQHWVCENAKSTRAFLKRVGQTHPLIAPLPEQNITELPRHVHKKGDHQSGFDGKPLLGASGWAGELGYFPVMVGDRVERLDNLAGGHAIAALCAVSPGLLAEQAKNGDLATLRAIASGGRALGLGLAALINLLNPSRLALGGGTVELPGYWEQALCSAEKYSIPELWRDCRISKVREGAFVVAKGAIRSVLQAD